MPGTGFSGTVRAEVLEFEPEKMIRVGWKDAEGGNSADWTITWSLEPAGRGPGSSSTARGSTRTTPCSVGRTRS